MDLYDFFTPISASVYSQVYTYLVMALCMLVVFQRINAEENELIYAQHSLPLPAIVLTLLIAIPIGFRNPLGLFGDTFLYTHTFHSVLKDYSPIDWSTEWLFDNWMFFFKDHGLEIQYFYLSVSLVYFGTMLVSCYKLAKNNTWIALLFCLVSYSCYTYSTNGVRNGLACNLVMLGIAALANIGANALMIPRFGITGAAVASTVSYVICGLCFLVFFCRKTGVPMLHMLLIRKEDFRLLKKLLSGK